MFQIKRVALSGLKIAQGYKKLIANFFLSNKTNFRTGTLIKKRFKKRFQKCFSSKFCGGPGVHSNHAKFILMLKISSHSIIYNRRTTKKILHQYSLDHFNLHHIPIYFIYLHRESMLNNPHADKLLGLGGHFCQISWHKKYSPCSVRIFQLEQFSFTEILARIRNYVHIFPWKNWHRLFLYENS